MTPLINFFLGTASSGTSGAFDRRRVLVLGALASAFVSAGFTVHRFILEPNVGLQHANILAATAILLAGPFVLRATGSYRLAAHLLVGGLSVSLTLDGWLTGGVASPSLYPMMAVPLMGTFYLGRRAGLGYAGALAVVLLGYYMLESSGIAPRQVPEALLRDVQFAAGAGMLMFMAFLAGFYESERIQATARQRAIMDNLADGILAVDATGQIQATNRALTRLLDVDAIGESLSDLPEGLGLLVAESQASGATEVRDLLLAGSRQGVAMASPIRLRQPALAEPIGTVVLIRDVTLERSVDQMKTDFTSMVSHELRTPMTSVLGFAKLIRSKLESTVLPLVPLGDRKVERAVTRVRGNLDIIVSEGERLTNLINDVLDIAKMESGHMEWASDEVDLGHLVKRAADATAGLFEEGDVVCVTEVEPELPALIGDENRLLQVLINLVSNASKFTDEGSVSISARRLDRDRIELRVTDTGPGIPQERQARVFERFRQVHDKTGGKARGTGLGLPISREIAVAHGGLLRVESEMGVGSSFIMELPTGRELPTGDANLEGPAREVPNGG